MRAVGFICLVVGYPVAIVGILRLRATFRTRDARWFAVEVIGTFLIMVGWLLRDRLPAVLTNGLWLAVLCVAWWWTGRDRGD